MPKGISHSDLLVLLRQRYEEPRYAFFTEVGNVVGFPSRRGDAIAMAMWRSLGLEVHGFEIKMSRTDWMHERLRPDKAEHGLFPYCDRWWLVLSEPEIIKEEEVPASWGVLVPKGKCLATVQKATKLTPVRLTREFVASVLRKALGATTEDLKRKERLRKRPGNTVEEIEQAGRSLAAILSHAQRRLDTLRYTVQELQKLQDENKEQEV